MPWQPRFPAAGVEHGDLISFVLTAEMRLSVEESGEEAILAVGVSRRERVGLVQSDAIHSP